MIGRLLVVGAQFQCRAPNRNKNETKLKKDQS